MANYIFPTSNTEGENYFVQFDIYKLKPPEKDVEVSTVNSTIGQERENNQSAATLAAASAETAEERDAIKAEAVAKAGGLTHVLNVAGSVVTDLLSFADNRESWQNTYNYKQRVSELVHSIKLPLQTAPTEVTSGTYADESTRDFQTIARILGGEPISAEEAQGLVQDETFKSIGKHVTRMQGKVLNQAQETFYTGPSKRDYAFNFSLIARNYEDSVQLSKIIRRFHYHAAPGHDDDKIFWSYPQMVRFRFLDKEGNRINLFSHTLEMIEGQVEQYASKACFINNVTAEYGVMGDQLRFLDEEFSRTGVANVKLTVSLKEAEYFTKADYNIDDANNER